MGRAVFPPCCLTWGQTMVEVMKIMGPPSKGPRHALPHSVPPAPQQATTDRCLHQRLLVTHRQIWVSLLWGHCCFLLGPGAHKLLFVPSKSLFPQSCVSSGGPMVGLMVTSPNRAYAKGCVTQICCTQSPFPCSRPLLTCTSTGDTQRQIWLSLCGISGSWCVQGFVWALWASLVGMAFDSKCEFAPPAALLGYGVSFWWDPTFSCRWLFSSEL